MANFSPVQSTPITLSSSVESKVYGLFGIAMALTAAGVYVGMQFAESLLTSGMYIVLLILELAILFTAPWWRKKSPLNMILFGAFPLLSGITVTPYLILVLTGYANGPSILFNALAATVFMALAAGVFAKTTSWNLSVMARMLIFSLLGLIAFSLLQIFVPALRTTQFELILSGAGVIIFALFTAYDVQRISQLSRTEGADAFLLALSLYLDIFNLFMYVIRFMIAFSGDRR